MSLRAADMQLYWKEATVQEFYCESWEYFQICLYIEHFRMAASAYKQVIFLDSLKFVRFIRV